LDVNEADNDFEQEFQNNNGRPFPNQVLWRRGNGNDFMLNVDMALAKDFEGSIDPDTGEVSCVLDDCPDSALLITAIEFSNSNNVWLTAFHDAFILMTNTGCEGTGACDAL
jgi:hypothetical protein